MNYLSSKNEHIFRNICTKLLINDNTGKMSFYYLITNIPLKIEININYPVVNSFVLFIPWMIYKSTNKAYKFIDSSIYKDNLDFQRITELKLESHDLLWVSFFNSYSVIKNFF